MEFDKGVFLHRVLEILQWRLLCTSKFMNEKANVLKLSIWFRKKKTVQRWGKVQDTTF